MRLINEFARETSNDYLPLNIVSITWLRLIIRWTLQGFAFCALYSTGMSFKTFGARASVETDRMHSTVRISLRHPSVGFTRATVGYHVSTTSVNAMSRSEADRSKLYFRDLAWAKFDEMLPLFGHPHLKLTYLLLIWTPKTIVDTPTLIERVHPSQKLVLPKCR